MMIFGETTLEKLNTVLVVSALVTLILLIFQHFSLSVISFIIFVFVCRMWIRSLGEELVISFLKRRGGRCTYDKLIEAYSKKILFNVSRLEKKEIVTIQDQEIILQDLNRVCAFDTHKKP